MRYLLIVLLAVGCAVQAVEPTLTVVDSTDTTFQVQDETEYVDFNPNLVRCTGIQVPSYNLTTGKNTCIDPVPSWQEQIDELRARVAVLECRLDTLGCGDGLGLTPCARDCSATGDTP